MTHVEVFLSRKDFSTAKQRHGSALQLDLECFSQLYLVEIRGLNGITVFIY